MNGKSKKFIVKTANSHYFGQRVGRSEKINEHTEVICKTKKDKKNPPHPKTQR